MMKLSTLGIVAFASLVAAPAGAAPRTETAVLAGGCFWGMEGVFEHVKGVKRSSRAMPAAAPGTRITTGSAQRGPATPRR